MRRLAFLTIAAVALTTSCVGPEDTAPPETQPAGAGASVPSTWTWAEQGWSDQTRVWFHHASQGSIIFPYEWTLVLEQASSQDKWIANEHIESFGFLRGIEDDEVNPDGLPIGFTSGPWQGRTYLGVTCAICHTNEIRYNGERLRIDGGPTMGDFRGLLNDLRAAMEATGTDEAKLGRLAMSVGAEADDQFKADFAEQTKIFADTVKTFDAAPLYGHGRLDAIGGILNRVTSVDLGVPENSGVPDAPVSFPFLWGAPAASWRSTARR